MENRVAIRIGVVVPITGMTAEQLEARKEHVLKVCSANVQVDFFQNQIGPLSIESHFEHEQAAVEVVKKAIELEKKGYHAIIPWCGGGPGVVSGREVLKIPIVGPFHSSCQIAAGLGYRFGVIIPLSKNIRMTRQRVYELKFESHLAAVRAVDISVLALKDDTDRLLDMLTDIGNKLIHDDGADVIATTCLGFCGMAKPLMERLSVPVVDPGWAAVALAEMLVKMGLTHSKQTYAYPKGFGPQG